jgi:hypothetical protein
MFIAFVSVGARSAFLIQYSGGRLRLAQAQAIMGAAANTV